MTSSLFTFIIKCLGPGRWLNWEPELATKNPFENPSLPIEMEEETVLWKPMDHLAWHVQQPTTESPCLEGVRRGLTYSHTHARTPALMLNAWACVWRQMEKMMKWLLMDGGPSNDLIIVPKISIPGSLFHFYDDGFILLLFFLSGKILLVILNIILDIIYCQGDVFSWLRSELYVCQVILKSL